MSAHASDPFDGIPPLVISQREFCGDDRLSRAELSNPRAAATLGACPISSPCLSMSAATVA
jgi:hypothetical protein